MTIKSQNRCERGLALVMVIGMALMCTIIAFSIVALRNQAMRVAMRQQTSELAHLDLEVRSAGVRMALTNNIKSAVQGQTVLDPATVAGKIAKDAYFALTGNASSYTDFSNANSYQLYTLGQSASKNSGTATFSLVNYVKNGPKNFSTLTLGGGNDPLANVPVYDSGSVRFNWGATSVWGANATDPTGQISAGRDSLMQIHFRQVPLSVYTVYSTPNLANLQLPSASFDNGDPGRVYAAGSIVASGTLNLSSSVVAEQQIGGSLSDMPTDVDLMAGNAKVFDLGSQSRGVQTLPFPDFNNLVQPGSTSTLSLGAACAFPLSYNEPVLDAKGNMTTAGTVIPAGTAGTLAAAVATQVQNDSNSLYIERANTNNTSAPAVTTFDAGYTAAVDPVTGKPTKTLIVLDYTKLSAITGYLGSAQTIFVKADATHQPPQAVLLRNVPADVGPQGFSIVSNLDIYVYGNIPVQKSTTAGVSLITSGKVYVVD